MLTTITPNHLDFNQITIRARFSHHYAVDFNARFAPDPWCDLDRLLVQLWKSRSVRSRIVSPWTRTVELKGRDLVLE
jgi:hypothetical protein